MAQGRINMVNGIKVWWQKLNKKQRSGILVLGLFFISVFILAAGIQVGQVFAKISSAF